MAGLGPMAGQNGHFNHAAPEKIPYAIDRLVQQINPPKPDVPMTDEQRRLLYGQSAATIRR